MSVDAKTIEALLAEGRSFPPDAEFRARARVTDESMYAAAEADFEGFWAEQARHYLSWYKDFDTALEWKLPFAQWFGGGELNASYQCLDRHVEAGRGDKVAFHWRGEEGEEREITYADLHRDVQRFANALKDVGATGEAIVAQCRLHNNLVPSPHRL